MSATIQANKAEYVTLMRKFVGSEIDGVTFSQEFLKRRRGDLEKDDERLKAWPEDYKIHLLDSYQQGKISKEEFDKKWHELWGYQPTRWLQIFDEIFDELDRYEPDGQLYEQARKDPDEQRRTYYITEAQLRDTVRGFLKELDSSAEC